MKHLTAFSWGYWGWGNHTRDFVRTVDAIECARGMRPPLFIDIRFSRSVRALGFRGSAFEETEPVSLAPKARECPYRRRQRWR